MGKGEGVEQKERFRLLCVSSPPPTIAAPDCSVEGFTFRYRRPHLRAPGYLHGAVGEITSIPGIFCDASFAAYGQAAPPQPLYRVAFRLHALWPEGRQAMLREGVPDDVVEADIAQPWLEAISPEAAAQEAQKQLSFAAAPAETDAALQQCLHDHNHDHAHGHDHNHGHNHDHTHGHGHDQEEHQARFTVEATAVEREGESEAAFPYKPLAEALIKVLTAQGLISPAELHACIAKVDAMGKDAAGPRLVARAWVDPDFKALLLQDAAAAAEKLGLTTSNYAADPASAAKAATAVPLFPHNHTVLRVVEDTHTVHNLVVCTLCR
jgi:hypothetical protein